MDLKNFADIKPEHLIHLLANNPQYQQLLQAHQAKLAQQQQQHELQSSASSTAVLPQYSVPSTAHGGNKYQQLLSIIEEISKDIRPTYSGNRNCAERLKRGIGHARTLVRDCMVELDKQAKQSNNP
uniref:Cyclin-dependent kinase 2-associated protein 1 n=1 Tax=Panagrolaimus sp. JU765 TaxID=591449 RepID=A0AC34R754_9BILA